MSGKVEIDAGSISDQISGPIIASIVIVVIVAIIGIAAAFAVLCGCRCCSKKRKEKKSDFLDDRTSYEAWSSKASLGTYELQEPARTVARDPNMDFVMGSGDPNYHQNRLSGWKQSLRNGPSGRPV